jgi:hypothetical protein
MALRTESRLQASLAEIAHLLDRHRVLETLTIGASRSER